MGGRAVRRSDGRTRRGLFLAPDRLPRLASLPGRIINNVLVGARRVLRVTGLTKSISTARKYGRLRWADVGGAATGVTVTHDQGRPR